MRDDPRPRRRAGPAGGLLCGGLAAVLAVAAHAQSFSLPSVARIGGGLDSDGGRDYSLDLDVDVAGGQRLELGLAQSHSGGAGPTLDPGTLRLGISSSPLDRLVVALRVEDWGQGGAITTRTLGGAATLNGDTWQIALAPQMRRIRIFFVTPNTRFGDSVEIASNGLELSGGFYLGERLFAGGGYFDNSYSVDPSVLQRASLALISDVTYSLASGLDQNGGHLSLDLSTDWGGLRLGWAQSVSAVDDARNRSTSVGLDYDLGTRASLLLTTGREETSAAGSLYFADLALLLSW